MFTATVALQPNRATSGKRMSPGPQLAPTGSLRLISLQISSRIPSAIWTGQAGSSFLFNDGDSWVFVPSTSVLADNPSGQVDNLPRTLPASGVDAKIARSTLDRRVPRS